MQTFATMAAVAADPATAIDTVRNPSPAIHATPALRWCRCSVRPCCRTTSHGRHAIRLTLAATQYRSNLIPDVMSADARPTGSLPSRVSSVPFREALLDGGAAVLDGAQHAVVAMRRLGIRLVVVGLAVGLVAALGAVLYITVFAVTSSGLSQSRACGPSDAGVPIEAGGGSEVTDEQLANAAVIVATGRELGVPERGLWVALGTALQESGLRNLDYGDRDSLGLFQQRPSQGWGSPAQVRDPRYSATQFYDRLVEVPSWAEMPLWQAAQTVQRSAFPLAYAKWEQTAADILAEVDGNPNLLVAAAVQNCEPGSVTPFDGSGTGCVEDDPTTNGCITATTLYAVTQAASAFGGLRDGPVIRSAGCHAQRPGNPSSDHPLGKGCDFFPGEGGVFARGIEVDNGWRAAEWFRLNAEALQVDYIIWQGRIWSPGSADEGGWGRRYTGGGVYDPGNAVGGHYDHIHVSFAT